MRELRGVGCAHNLGEDLVNAMHIRRVSDALAIRRPDGVSFGGFIA